jgi:hypothetical protein
MTRSNLHIKLSNGYNISCVADSSSAPEQGYFVEQVLQTLLELDDPEKELQLIEEHCTMNEQRVNATYRYIINLQTKAVHFFEENYNYKTDKFFTGENLTNRYRDYLETITK